MFSLFENLEDKTNIFESSEWGEEHLVAVKANVDFDPAAATKKAEEVMGPIYLTKGW